MVYSWYSSYPLSIDSSEDFVFNHVSVFYWVSLPLILTSMFLIAITSRSYSVKWLMTVGIIVTMYSLSYFYYMLPGSDSHSTRGLVEYFSATKNLDPLQPNKDYFQWPSLFLLADTVTSISGLKLANVEFLLYAVIGFLMATTLYVYASKAFKNGGFLAVIAFFVVVFTYLNYQFVPFSLAFALFLLLLLVESRQATWGRAQITVVLVLFVGISIAHAFVPFFYVIFLLIAYIVSRNKRYGVLCLLASIIYLTVQITLAPTGFANNIWSVINQSSEYSSFVRIHSVFVPIDAIAQVFSTTTTISLGAVCIAGSIILLARRKMRNLDKILFLTGITYLSLGISLYALGSRAFPIIFIPISLGASYLLEHAHAKFALFLKCLLVILLVLFVFTPLHLSFYRESIQFQTSEAYKAENFFTDHYDWSNNSFILADFRVETYFESKMVGNASIVSDPLLWIKEVDAIFYSVGLELRLQDHNYTMDKLLHEQRLNLVYDDGLSSAAIRSSNFTWALNH